MRMTIEQILPLLDDILNREIGSIVEEFIINLGKEDYYATLRITREGISIIENYKGVSDIFWRPMGANKRDDLVYIDKDDSRIVKKEDGMAVLVVDGVGYYKIVKGPNNGILIYCFSWDHTVSCRKILEGDLEMGYEILFISVGENEITEYSIILDT